MKPKISFVMPVYNGAPFMVQTMESIRKQKMKEIEIIVVDDGSTDSLYELMKYYTNIDNRIKYFRFEDNMGAARCRNYGNKKAQTDIICVTDCGNIYPSCKARLVYNYLKNHPDIGVFSTAVTCIDHFGIELHTQRMRAFGGKKGEKPNISHPTAAYRKWIALKWPYRETSKATDNYDAFFLTLAKNGIKFGATNKVYMKMLHIHYKHYRDVGEGRRIKKQVYKEFDIPIPTWLEKY